MPVHDVDPLGPRHQVDVYPLDSVPPPVLYEVSKCGYI